MLCLSFSHADGLQAHGILKQRELTAPTLASQRTEKSGPPRTEEQHGGNPLGKGVGYGAVFGLIHVIGPDHLCSLLLLSTSAEPIAAFRVGAAWGLGHSSGMVLIAIIFLLLHGAVGARMHMESWEHYGNYVIGASMVLCSLYFLHYQSVFLQEQNDGSFKPVPCKCDGPCKQLGVVARQRPSQLGQQGAKLIASPPIECRDVDPKAPPEDLQAPPEDLQVQHGRGSAGLLLGAMQGLCCPIGLAAVGFLMSLTPSGIFAFLVTFFLTSILGTGLLSAAWAQISRIGCVVSPRSVYLFSCAVTLLAGIVWIVGNACGFIDLLNYAEAGELPSESLLPYLRA